MSTHETVADPNPDLDEVAFWRRFIAWWEAKEGRPATPRMWEALAHAQARRSRTRAPAGVGPYNEPEDAKEGAPGESEEPLPTASGSTGVRPRH